jgi:hypothetical protein
MTSLYSVRALLAFTLTIFNFHVHVDRPDVHTLGVVRNDSFEHRAATLGMVVSKF